MWVAWRRFCRPKTWKIPNQKIPQTPVLECQADLRSFIPAANSVHKKMVIPRLLFSPVLEKKIGSFVGFCNPPAMFWFCGGYLKTYVLIYGASGTHSRDLCTCRTKTQEQQRTDLLSWIFSPLLEQWWQGCLRKLGMLQTQWCLQEGPRLRA